VAVVVSARLRELDLSIEEAAMDLGAKPWKVFFLITIPMIAPSLAAGGMMSFALSLDDLVLASFVSGPGSTTLPMEVFSAVRLGVKPEINAVASLILLAVSLVTFMVWYFSRRRSHPQAGDPGSDGPDCQRMWQQPKKQMVEATA
jgi:putrescine transport system permease protein